MVSGTSGNTQGVEVNPVWHERGSDLLCVASLVSVGCEMYQTIGADRCTGEEQSYHAGQGASFKTC